MTVTTCIILQKISISNKFSSFELSITQRILNKMYHGFHKYINLRNCFQH